jgi:ABC-2 type transport system permease protein
MESLLVLRVNLRTACLLSLQYRVDFVVQVVMSLFWTAAALAPLVVLFRMRPGVAGWTWPEALVVIGFFVMLKGLLAGAVQPALPHVVEHVRKGTLDFLLLKPVDAQLLLSTSRLDLARVTDVLAGGALVGWALTRANRPLTTAGVAVALLLLACGVLILYSMGVVVVSLAFRVVKVDNLSYLIGSTFDAGRWPSSVFRGALAFLFTFVFPLALMTTYPALALLGRITPGHVLTSLAVAGAFLAASRLAWLGALRSYTSAGG